MHDDTVRASPLLPLFCSTDLAAQIERAECEFISAATQASRERTQDPAAFVRSLAGGAACFAEDGSPMNKVVGVGFHDAPTDAELDEVEQLFAAVGATAQFELSSLGDPRIPDALTRRGYRLISFENVLGIALEQALPPSPAGIEVRVSTEDEREGWIDLVVGAFADPDGQGVPSHEDFPRSIIDNAMRDIATAGSRRYIAFRNGIVAGGGGLRIAGRIAQLTGAATAPPHRRRGVQTALLATRLADATAAGCALAVVTTQPGSKSQQNAQRRGFQLLYTRAVLVKP